MTTFQSKTPWPNLRRNLVAILRGIETDAVEPVVDTLIEAGFEAIEIPLNSPDPFISIERAAKRAPSGVLIGAGTVLDAEDVKRLDGAGGRLLVTPNVDPGVLEAAHGFGMVTMPGVFTASEAFTALKTGASGLKFFPASVLGPGGIAAIKAVLPKDVVVGAVGGVSEDDFEAYGKAGVTAYGLGSCLYKPDFSPSDIAQRAKRIIATWDALHR